MLAYSCAFLRRESSQPGCRVYTVRPTVCSLFPIDERDLRDRDLIRPDHPCGFTFVPEGAVETATPPRTRPGFVDLTRYHATEEEVRTHAQ